MADSRAVYKCTKKKITSRDMWNTNLRVGWNANLLKWMTQTVSRLHLWVGKFAQWKGHTSKEKMCWQKPGRMAERSKAPDSRHPSIENSGTRVCAWVRIPLLSENVLITMRQSPQLTNSVILERQFQMTVQSKRKQKNRKVVWGSQSRLGFAKSSGVDKRAVWNYTKKDTQTGHVKHECTRGFKRKSLQTDDTNRLADKISEKQIQPNWKITERTEKCRRKPSRMAERSKTPGSRTSTVENSGTRMCAWVRIELLSENVFNTMRQSLQLTNSLILERQFQMTVQRKRNKKKRNVIRGWYPSNFKVPKKEDTQPRH